mgnify:FL=1|tara:strand:+ start:200 stop:862 length:663 start_codon:yes stop_codon:yes gene_type:complete
MAIGTYNFYGTEVQFYNYQGVGDEKWGYTGGGTINTSSIINSINAEVDLLLAIITSTDQTGQPIFSASQRLDMFQELIGNWTDKVSDLDTHNSYWASKVECCGWSPFRNCLNKCGHSRKMINAIYSTIYNLRYAYNQKLKSLIQALEQEQLNLENDINNQGLIAVANFQIAEANNLLLAVQLNELEVREMNVETNIRNYIFPILAVVIIAIMYYRAFIKK